MTESLFQSGPIRIDKNLAVFGDTTYPIANIGAVSIEEIPADDKLGWLIGLVAFGLVLAFAFESVLGLVICLGLAAVIYFFGRTPLEQKIVLQTSSGNVQAFTSSDIHTVQEIKAAIETAVTLR